VCEVGHDGEARVGFGREVMAQKKLVTHFPNEEKRTHPLKKKKRKKKRGARRGGKGARQRERERERGGSGGEASGQKEELELARDGHRSFAFRRARNFATRFSAGPPSRAWPRFFLSLSAGWFIRVSRVSPPLAVMDFSGASLVEKVGRKGQSSPITRLVLYRVHRFGGYTPSITSRSPAPPPPLRPSHPSRDRSSKVVWGDLIDLPSAPRTSPDLDLLQG